MLDSPSRLTYELLLLYHIDKYVDFFYPAIKAYIIYVISVITRKHQRGKLE